MPKKMDYFLWKLQQKQRWMSTNYFLRLVRKIELWLFVFISESFGTFFLHFVLRILSVFFRSRLNSFCHPVILERACFEVCQKHLMQLVQFCLLISSCHGNLNFSAFLAFRFFICLHNELSSFNSIILLLSVTFTAKLELFFVLTLENAFLRVFILS